MAEHSAQERTEQATPKRRADSRRKGQVPRSRELATVVSLLAGGLGMLIFGSVMTGGIARLLAGGLSFGAGAAFDEAAIATRLSGALFDSLLLLAPLFALLLISVFVSPLALGGLVWNVSLVAPKLERIDPGKGLGRIFSLRGLMELLKAIAKFALVSAAAVGVLALVFDELFRLPTLPLEQSLAQTGRLFIWCFLGFSSVLILVAAVDVPFQFWEHLKQLRMTKQEIKDEMKETEGRPEVKSQIRERQQQAARARMMTDVPKADVVITNPTHFAVALRYERDKSTAPRVVAKGRDLVAARIRELAREHKVAIFSAPPLARALYASTDIGQEIPGNLFVAVAQVLAYVYQLRKAGPFDARPKAPADLPVPAEYDKQFSKGGEA